MPKSVEEVRCRTDRVRLGGEVPWSFASRSSAFVLSGEGDGGKDGVEAGVKSKVRRGTGLRTCEFSDMV